MADSLKAAWAKLNHSWNIIGEGWNDSVQQRFESDCIKPLEKEYKATQKEIDRLRAILNQARRNTKF
jgi:hypothetical protein